MAGNLFPVFDVPGELADDLPEQQRYRPAPLFDLASGEFVLDGARRPMYGNGQQAWILWCCKTILTQRWAHLAYSGNAGIEADEAFREPDRQSQESALRRTVTEALLADPMGRAQQVRDFEFSWLADSLHITCTVIGADGNSAVVTAALGK